MKPFSLLGALFVCSLSLTLAPSTALAHAGHGDEFQSTGGVNRVEVKSETDSLLGIKVDLIEPSADGSDIVLIPATALVEDAGRQLVFVQYKNFYEPVDVATGATQGELIEVTKGLSVGEQLVTQGGLSLYAESRKTQAVESDAETDPTASTGEEAEALVETEAGTMTHAQADAEGIAHTHDDDHHQGSTISKKAALAAAGGLAVLGLGGAVFFMNRGNQQADS